MKMARVLEHLSSGDRLRELELSSLEKRQLRENLPAVFQYLKQTSKKDADGLFGRACCDRTKADVFKLSDLDLL